MTPDTITLADLTKLRDASISAMWQLSGMCESVEDGDISPAEAHAKLTEILAPLQMPKLAKPEPEWRYFGNSFCRWKMPVRGAGFIRLNNGAWQKSMCKLKDIIADKVEEISMEVGES